MGKGNSEKAKFIDSLIPSPLLDYLKDGRYMCIGGSLFQATAKPNSTGGYMLDFIEIDKTYLNATQSNNKYADDVYYHYSYDTDIPIPCNIREDFEFVVKGTIWNAYHYPPYSHQIITTEKELEEKCPSTMKLFRHIYRDSLVLGLDYATVELMNPTQKLPVQVLYSRENKTAKSTILNQRKWMYGHNGAMISSENFNDAFNAPVVGKNFIGLDEGKLKGDGALEKMKMLVTSPSIIFRAMRKSGREVPNFGKYFIATNYEYFAKLDEHDSRFWMIECKKIEGGYDRNFDDNLKKEIPYWIGFHKYRWDNRGVDGVEGLMKMENPKAKDRLWFTEEQYTTEALKKVKRFWKSPKAKEILDELIDWFDKNNHLHDLELADKQKNIGLDKPVRMEVDEIRTTAKNIKDALGLSNAITTVDIKRVLEDEFNLHPITDFNGKIKNETYLNYLILDNNNKPSSARSRNVFEIKYSHLIKLRDGEDIEEAVKSEVQGELKM